MVLHHVADDPVLIEVAATCRNPKIFLENDLDAFDVLPIPNGLPWQSRMRSHLRAALLRVEAR